MPNRSLAVLCGVLLCAVMAVAAWARPLPHPVLNASAIATVLRDGTIQVSVHHDALAFAMNDLPGRIDDAQMMGLLRGPREDLQGALEAGRARFEKQLEIVVDGAPVAASILSAPTVEQAETWRDSGARPVLPVKLDFIARAGLPAGAKKFAIRFPEMMGDVVITVQTPGAEPLAANVRAGERSEEYAFALDAPRIPGTVTPEASGGVSPLPAAATPVVGSTRSGLGFVRMGFTHIIPEGLDHILFVLGLFFLSPKIRPLLIQITCFTLAHSVTLALSVRGVISLPSSVVEPAIAASIAFVAIENICTQKVHAWRPAIVFGFGLVHGLGFASSFAEAMNGQKVPLGPVLLFNVGVEAGQLTVVAAALLAVGWFQAKPWYRGRIAIPASVLIAGMGVFWVVQRVFFP